MTQMLIDNKGIKVVEINKIKFKGKRKIDWKGVEEYLKNYIGKKYIIDDMNDVIYIGTDFPDEYANSRDSVKAKGTIGKQMQNMDGIGVLYILQFRYVVTTGNLLGKMLFKEE